MQRRLKSASYGFAMADLMLAVALSIYATTLFCIWASSLLLQRATAHQKIAMITAVQSLADQLSIDERLLSKGHIVQEQITYRWRTKSLSLNQFDAILGKADTPRYFKLLELNATAHQAGTPTPYTFKRGLA